MKIKINFTPKGIPFDKNLDSCVMVFNVGDFIESVIPFYKRGNDIQSEIVSKETRFTVEEYKAKDGQQFIRLAEYNDEWFYPSKNFKKV